MTVEYTLTLTVRRTELDADGIEWLQSVKAKRELEREVLRALRVLDGDCDVEVMNADEVEL